MRKQTFTDEIEVSLSKFQRELIAKALPQLRPRLRLEEGGSRLVAFTLNLLQAIYSETHGMLAIGGVGCPRHSLGVLAARVEEGIRRLHEVDAIPITERLYQFHIQLEGIEPPIWRRIHVKDCTLDRFHEHIQVAMGWTNSHLHHFEVAGMRYMDPSQSEGEIAARDSTLIRLRDIVPRDGHAIEFSYLYDFGDHWLHAVRFEGCLRAEGQQRFPRCLEGAHACPPEDVGGTYGYKEYLEAIADPDHERHEEMKLWNGPYDPEQFSAERATRLLHRGLPRPSGESLEQLVSRIVSQGKAGGARGGPPHSGRRRRG